MATGVLELTDATFAENTANGVVLVDFYGTWCPPCKLLDPVVERLAADFAGRALIARINIDDNAESAVDNAIEDIPTLIFFKAGQEAERLFGAQRLETLSAELNKLLA